MTHTNLIIDGISILNTISKLNNDETSSARLFIDHVRYCLKQQKPKNAVILLPSEITSPAVTRINPIIDALGITQITTSTSSLGNDIYSIARQMAESEAQVLVSSSSLAVSQVTSSNVDFSLYTSKSKPTILSPHELSKTIGVKIEQIPSLVAIIGDQELGFKNYIGPQSAIQLLREHANLDAIFAEIQSVPRAVRANLEKNELQIKEQYNLVNFTHQNTNFMQLKLSRDRINQDILFQHYIHNRFFDWLPDEIRAIYIPKTSPGSETTYTKIADTKSDYDNLFSAINSTGSCAIALTHDESGASLCMSEGSAFFIPINNNDGKEFIINILQDPNIRKVSHDAKKLYKWCFKQNADLTSLQSDSAILAYSIDSSNSERSVSSLCKDYLDLDIRSEASNPALTMIGGEEDISSYYGEIADATWRVNRKLYAIASKDVNARTIFEKIDRPMIEIIAKMEHVGVLIDGDKLSIQGDDVRQKLEKLQAEVDSIAKKPINVNSQDEVADLLFTILKIDDSNIKKTNGKHDTSEESLARLATESDIPGKITEIRKLARTSGSGIASLISKVNPQTGRVHAQFLQNVTSTGRLSTRDPNLQGTQKKTDNGRRIRDAFIATRQPKGTTSLLKYIISADYSQVELRILAELSGDENLISIFRNKLDVHRATAAEIFGIPLPEVSDEQRNFAKAINFGIVYGQTAFGLSKKLGCPLDEASKYIKLYFSRYPKVGIYLNSVKGNARANGYVLTYCGRKIFTHNIRDNNKQTREHAERAAINAPMQGTAADIIKLAMLSIDYEFKKLSMSTTLLMQVHDELVFEVPAAEVISASKIIKEKMESAVPFKVDLLVELTCGRSWSQASAIDLDKYLIDEMCEAKP